MTPPLPPSRPPRPQAGPQARWLLLASLLTLATGCFGPRPDQRRYFTLHLASPARGAAVHKGQLRVQDLDISRVYDRNPMLIRRSDVEVHYASDDLWAERPHQLVSDLLATWLEADGLFEGVSRQLGERPPAWELSGRLHAIEIVQGPKQWSVRLALVLELRDFVDGSSRWRTTFDARQPVPPSDPAAAASALSALLTRALQEAVVSLRKLPEMVPKVP